MRPEEVSELSRLFDAALALAPTARAIWLAELETTQPGTARHLRSMLAQTRATDTALLLKLPPLESDDTVARAGERVGPYQLVREIGHGGMGSVWLAERVDGAFKRRVAVKLPRLAWGAGLAKRMARERDIGALLEHPNIARLYDAGVDEHGRPYIAMEYIEGQPIDVYCRDHALDLRARLKLFLQVAHAVAYAHGRLVLHRDLKPGNVLVDTSGQAHLLDFGIAKLLDEAGVSPTELTREQGRVLTLNYASPEQIAGRPLGVTADVYALGVMLYELLTGTLPYRSKRNTAAAIEEAILAGDAPPASSRVTDRRLAHALRGDLDAIVEKAIKREATERYATADALAADVERYLDGRAIEARPDSAWYRLRKAVVRHRVPVTASAVILAVALAGATATFLQGRRAAAEAQRTQLATEFVSELLRVSAAFDNPKDPARFTPEARIERGAQLIEARFERQPEMKAEMYGTVARVYVDLGIPRPASEYADRQLNALLQQKANGERIAKAQLLLAEAALTAHRHKDAEDYTRRALQSLPDSSARVPDALALLARSQFLNGKTEEAKQTVAEARRLLVGQRAEDSVALSRLLYVEAELLRIEGKYRDTDALVDRAIEDALKVEGPLSRTAIEMRLHRAQVLALRFKLDQSRRMQDAALAALHALGGVHELRAALVTASFQTSLSSTGLAPYPETVAILEEVRATLDAHGAPVPAEVRAEVDYNYGFVLMMSGNVGAGAPLLLRSAEVLADSQQDLWRQYAVAQWSGTAYLFAGDHVAAEGAFRRALHMLEEWGRGQSAGIEWLLVARSLTMQGRPQEAEAFLSTAPKFVAEPPLTPQPQNLIAYERAYARLVAGDAAGASKLLPRDDPNSYSRGWLAGFIQLLHGEVLCAVGDRSAGLQLLRRAMEEYLALGMINPDLAYTRAIAGRCALELGERKQAEQWAALARTYFEAQPDVSPFFKKPLVDLEKRLAESQPNRIGSRRVNPSTRTRL